MQMGTWGKGSQWCNRLPSSAAAGGGGVSRLLVLDEIWTKEKGGEKCNEEADYDIGCDRGDGADDGVWEHGSVRCVHQCLQQRG